MRIIPKVFDNIADSIKRYKWFYIIGLISLVCVDGLQLVIPKVFKWVVDDLATGLKASEVLLKYGAYIVLLSVGIALTRFAWRTLIIGASRRIERDLRQKFFDHIQTLSFSYFNRTKTGDLMAHATNDIEAVRMATGIALVAATDATLLSLASIILMLTISPSLTLVTMIPLPVLSFVVFRFSKMLHTRFRAVQESFSQLTDKVQETYTGIRVVKGYAQEDNEEKRFSKFNKDYLEKNIRLIRVWGILMPMIGSIIGISQALLLFYGGRKVILGQMSIGDFVAFTAYLDLLIWPMIAIGWVVNLYERGKASMERINKILATEPEIKDAPHVLPVEDIKGDIEIRNLTFRYLPGLEPVLRDISMRIKQGETIGIIGRTGAGKSTLAHLLPRIFTVPQNTIFIDGVDINRIPLHILRKNIGFVPQDPFLYSMSIADNIRYGVPMLSIDDVMEAARMANIDGDIQSFPDHYETMVGERGVTLSGGQKQRVSIARAVAIDPKILILDDALSAVDTRTEEKILKQLKSFMRQRTSIIITHRAAAVVDADRIYVIDDGVITEQGTHQELLALKGYYYRLYQWQATDNNTEH